MDRGACWAIQYMGLQRVRHDWAHKHTAGVAENCLLWGKTQHTSDVRSAVSVAVVWEQRRNTGRPRLSQHRSMKKKIEGSRDCLKDLSFLPPQFICWNPICQSKPYLWMLGLEINIIQRGKKVQLPEDSAKNLGASLVVQWLRLHASSAGAPGLIPGQGTKKFP